MDYLHVQADNPRYNYYVTHILLEGLNRFHSAPTSPLAYSHLLHYFIIFHQYAPAMTMAHVRLPLQCHFSSPPPKKTTTTPPPPQKKKKKTTTTKYKKKQQQQQNNNNNNNFLNFINLSNLIFDTDNSHSKDHFDTNSCMLSSITIS